MWQSDKVIFIVYYGSVLQTHSTIPSYSESFLAFLLQIVKIVSYNPYAFRSVDILDLISFSSYHTTVFLGELNYRWLPQLTV